MSLYVSSVADAGDGTGEWYINTLFKGGNGGLGRSIRMG